MTTDVGYQLHPVRLIVAFAFCVVSLSDAQQLNYWIPLQSPTNKTINRVVFVDSITGFIAGKTGLLMKTTNGGSTWQQLQDSITTEFTDIQFVSDSIGFAISLKYPTDDDLRIGSYLFSTSNGGNDWKIRFYDSLLFRAIWFFDSTTGFLGASSGTIVKTTDGGSTLKIVSDSAKHRWPIYKFTMYSREYGIAVGGQLEIMGAVWMTHDGGESWFSQQISSEPIFNATFFDSLHILVAMAEIDQSGAGFMRTYDGGSSWSYEPTQFWGEPNAFAFRTKEEIWVPMGIAGICLRSTNEGFQWETIKTPNNALIYDISFPDSKHGYMAGFQGGFFKYNSSVMSIRRSTSGEPSFRVENTYPNPFNNSTSFRYSIPAASHVTIEVFDVLGRVVNVLQDTYMEQGTYQDSWNATGNTSGLYYLRITAGRSTEIRKMMLVQ